MAPVEAVEVVEELVGSARMKWLGSEFDLHCADHLAEIQLGRNHSYNCQAYLQVLEASVVLDMV